MKQLLFFIALAVLVWLFTATLPESHIEVVLDSTENKEVTFEEEIPKKEKVTPEPIAESEEIIVEDIIETKQETITELPPIETEVRTPLPQNEIYEKGLNTIVNLVCPINDSLHALATGAVISEKGHILSVAHITDKIDTDVTCRIRRGSPARDFGTAKLLFIPDAYTQATTTNTQAPFDFSIWKLENVTEPLTYWDIIVDESLTRDENVLTLSYAAEINTAAAQSNLNLLFSVTTVEVDDGRFVQSKSTISAQEGSSGGILIDPYTASIRGLIFGVSKDEKVFERRLFSLTPRAIETTLIQETSKKIEEYLTAPLD